MAQLMRPTRIAASDLAGMLRLEAVAAGCLVAACALMIASSVSLTPEWLAGSSRRYQYASAPSAIVAIPATTKALRHDPRVRISHAMIAPPNAAPSGAPLSTSTAPRPRSLGESQLEL